MKSNSPSNGLTYRPLESCLKQWSPMETHQFEKPLCYVYIRSCTVVEGGDIA